MSSRIYELHQLGRFLSRSPHNGEYEPPKDYSVEVGNTLIFEIKIIIA